MNEKETGSFYTPHKLIEYMVSYVKSRLHPSSILEPSAGDGRFINALSDFQSTIIAVELDEGKVRELNEKYGVVCDDICCDDFINYSLESEKTFDLIIGNPPYIVKKVLDETQCEKSEKIVDYYKLDKSVFQNLWVSFVLSSIKLLSKEGALFFVLPFEFLQVQYAEKLRGFLETKFNTIEIITFEERVFEGIEQDICLVYLANEVQEKPYIKYTTLISAEDTNWEQLLCDKLSCVEKEIQSIQSQLIEFKNNSTMEETSKNIILTLFEMLEAQQENSKIFIEQELSNLRHLKNAMQGRGDKCLPKAD